MAENFKGIFKVILAILTYKEGELIDLGFEGNLEVLGKIVESELFRNTNFE